MLNLKLQRGGLRFGVTRQFVMFIKIEHAYYISTSISGYQLRIWVQVLCCIALLPLFN